jgi:3-hydroxyisobutyrate dehydrogenase-like beta-hydroxyacid dehydrogenase
MASYLSKSNKYDLYVYNRTQKTQKKWLNKNLANKYNFEDDIQFDFIITCLKDDRAINDIVKKIIKIKCFHKSSILIDHSTISFDQVSQLNQIIKKNKFKFVDAPITGGEEGAKKGSLSIMAGATHNSFLKIKQVISCYSKSVVHMGNVGSGQLTKFTNQILICGILYSISEAHIFSKKNKLNQKKLYEVIKNGAAGSWQFTNRYQTIVNNKFNFGFSTKLMEKDLRYVLRHSKNKGISLKLTKEVHKKYQKLQSTIYKNQDTSSLIKAFLT